MHLSHTLHLHTHTPWTRHILQIHTTPHTGTMHGRSTHSTHMTLIARTLLTLTSHTPLMLHTNATHTLHIILLSRKEVHISLLKGLRRKWVSTSIYSYTHKCQFIPKLETSWCQNLECLCGSFFFYKVGLVSYTFINPVPCLTGKLLIPAGKGVGMSFSIGRKKFLDSLHRILLPEIVS